MFIEQYVTSQLTYIYTEEMVVTPKDSKRWTHIREIYTLDDYGTPEIVTSSIDSINNVDDACDRLTSIISSILFK